MISVSKCNNYTYSIEFSNEGMLAINGQFTKHVLKMCIFAQKTFLFCDHNTIVRVDKGIYPCDKTIRQE